MLKDIVGYLGTVFKLDSTTITKPNIAATFPYELYFSNEHDELITQPIQYEQVPVWCSKCLQFGHTPTDCRMGKPKPSKPQLEVDEKGFRLVKKGFKGGYVKATKVTENVVLP